MIKLFFRPENDLKIKKRMLTKWQKENPRDELDVDVSLRFEYSHVVINGKVVGFIAGNSWLKHNILELVYINKEHRGKGYMSIVFRAMKDYGVLGLHIGLCGPNFSKFSAIYAAAGFPYFRKLFSMTEGVIGEYFLSEDTLKTSLITSPVVGQAIFATDDDLGLAPGSTVGTLGFITPQEVVCNVLTRYAT